jgi:hypothetical protein
MRTLDFLQKRIQELRPDKEMCLRATRHLSSRTKKDLFNSKVHPRRNAEGHLYEALIYEIALQLSEEGDFIKGVVRKGADVPKKRPRPSLNQNGLFYDPDRYIVIRGHGQDLGEVDLVLVDNESNLLFVEVVISGQNLRKFDKEIDYKRGLLREIAIQPSIPFLLISSVDLTNRQIAKKLLQNPDNSYLTGPSIEAAKSLLDEKSVLAGTRPINKSSKLLNLKDITVNREFDYGRIHDKMRNVIFDAVRRDSPLDTLKTEVGSYPIVSKAIMGGLRPYALEFLFSEGYINLNRREMTPDDSRRFFSNLVLAINLPELRPVLYLKVRKKFLLKKWRNTYLKLGPRKMGSFTFERNIHSHVGFHRWLEEMKPTIGKELTRSILSYFLRKEILGYRGKHERPNIDIRSVKE